MVAGEAMDYCYRLAYAHDIRCMPLAKPALHDQMSLQVVKEAAWTAQDWHDSRELQGNGVAALQFQIEI